MKRDGERRGPTICMFNHECFQRQGEVVGACMDGFLFGTCCELPLTNDITMATDAMFDQYNYTDGGESTSQSPLSSAIASQYEKFGSQSQTATENEYNPVITYEPVKLEDTPNKTVSSIVVNIPSKPAAGKPIFNKLDNNYITNDDLDEDIVSSNLNSHKLSISDSAVSVFSPSTSNVKNEAVEIATTHPDPPPVSSSASFVEVDSNNNVYSTEIPSSLNAFNDHPPDTKQPETETSTDITASGVQMIANQIYQENQLFDHSDITHPEAETDLINENGAVDQSYANPSDFDTAEEVTEQQPTEPPVKINFPKPLFKPKPKPTQPPETNNYVLVHTISSDPKDEENQTAKPTVSVNNIHSIESIILMLNETNLGPQYDTDSDTRTENVTMTMTIADTTSPATYATSTIDYEKYGPTSFYITKPQKTSPSAVSMTTRIPSTSYVYNSKPTRRPILEPVVVQATLLTNAYGTTAVTQKDPSMPVSTIRPVTNKPTSFTDGPSKRPILIISEADHTVPSGYYTTSGGSSPSPISVSSIQPTKKVTTKRPVSTTMKLPEYIVQSSTLSHQAPSTIENVDYIHVATASQNPSPTIHITPKPVPGLVTSSTWNNNKKQTTPSSNNQQSGFYENTPPPVYVSSLADFEDEGYFGHTKRPVAKPTMSSTAMYNVVDNNSNNNNKLHVNYVSSTYAPYGSTPSYPTKNRIPPSSQPGQMYIAHPLEASTMKNELYTTPDDVNNFPPVRNPNLNLTDSTMMTNITKIENDNFAGITDEDKMNMLVNKIVQSFNGNFEELEAILKQRKNMTLSPTSSTTTTTTKAPGSTSKPVTKKKKKRPSGSKKPSNGTSSSTNGIKKPAPVKPTVVQEDPAYQTTTSTTTAKPKSSKKPSKIKRPSNSTKPTSSKPTSSTSGSNSAKPVKLPNNKPKPSASSTRPKPPSSSGTKPSADEKPPTNSKPLVTTKKPARPSTSKKPSATKKPTNRPSLDETEPITVITTRKPTKVSIRRPVPVGGP